MSIAAFTHILQNRRTAFNQERLSPTGDVRIRDIFFRSHIASWTAKSLAACTLSLIPLVVESLGYIIAPYIKIACILASIAIPFILAYVYRKELLFDISLIYTVIDGVWNKKRWWDDVGNNIILSAIPLTQHLDELKSIGVTHVLSMVESFELEPGIIEPISHDIWTREGVKYRCVNAQDFLGVPPLSISQAIQFVKESQNEILQSGKGKILIHCKAGRGRSATVVAAYKMELEAHHNSDNGNSKDHLDMIIAQIKERRPQVNLNVRQKATILEYVTGKAGNI